MQPKTPITQDKRLFLAVGTIVSLLVAKYLGVELDPEMLAAIVATVLGYITNSAMKEAKVAGAMAAAGVTTKADALAALEKGPNQ